MVADDVIGGHVDLAENLFHLRKPFSRMVLVDSDNVSKSHGDGLRAGKPLDLTVYVSHGLASEPLDIAVVVRLRVSDGHQSEPVVGMLAFGKRKIRSVDT